MFHAVLCLSSLSLIFESVYDRIEVAFLTMRSVRALFKILSMRPVSSIDVKNKLGRVVVAPPGTRFVVETVDMRPERGSKISHCGSVKVT